METIKLLQLIQATSGLTERKNTPILADGKPVNEIRITMNNDMPCVNLVTEAPSEEAYDVRWAFDQEHNEWICLILLPEEDKLAFERVCEKAGITAEECIRKFFEWLVNDTEAAMRWLKGEKE